MSTLEYSSNPVPTAKLAVTYAVVSLAVGVAANVWGAFTAWHLHAATPNMPFASRGLEAYLFFQAMVAAIVGVGFGLAALAQGRGRVGIILLACVGLHLSLTPYLVSNAVLDHVATSMGIELEI